MQAKKQELAWDIAHPLHEELPRMSHRLTAFAVNYKSMWLPQTGHRYGTIHFTCHNYKNIVTYSCTRDIGSDPQGQNSRGEF